MFEPSIDRDLCNGCAEEKPKGIVAYAMHCCPLNTVTYPISSFKLRHLEQIISGIDPLRSFKDLLDFPHFKGMIIDDNTTMTDANNYRLARDFEIRSMKRLRAYIKLEEEFNSRY